LSGHPYYIGRIARSFFAITRLSCNTYVIVIPVQVTVSLGKILVADAISGFKSQDLGAEGRVPAAKNKVPGEFGGSAHFNHCHYRAMHFSAKRGIAIACRPSVRPSVCLSECNVQVP